MQRPWGREECGGLLEELTKGQYGWSTVSDEEHGKRGSGRGQIAWSLMGCAVDFGFLS